MNFTIRSIVWFPTHWTYFYYLKDVESLPYDKKEYLMTFIWKIYETPQKNWAPTKNRDERKKFKNCHKERLCAFVPLMKSSQCIFLLWFAKCETSILFKILLLKWILILCKLNNLRSHFTKQTIFFSHQIFSLTWEF